VVYKKYKIINGKRYGPYLYENKRVGDRVITSYFGKSKENNDKQYIQYILIAIFLTLGILIFIHFSFSPTGKAILDVQSSYTSGEHIAGNMNLVLKSGELLPKETKVIARLGNESREVALSELLDEESTSGDFFAEGTNISGYGEGYGVLGSKITYPEIDFSLVIAGISGTADSQQEESSPITINETITPDNSQDSLPEPSLPETAPSESIPIEETNSDTSESPVTQSSVVNNDASVEQTSTESSNTAPDSNSGSLLTGSVVAENEKLIDGKASKGNDFVYSINDGETASISSGSVKHNGVEIGDNNANLRIENGIASVSTDFSVNEKGFGSNYLGPDALMLKVDLSKLDLNASSDMLSIKLVYGDSEIVSAEKEISVGESNSIPEINDAEQFALNYTDNLTLIDNMTYLDNNFSLIKNIPLIRIAANDSVQINLKDYFSGAENYSFYASNISYDVLDEVITLTPDEGVKGVRKGRITAYLENLSLESNEFDILISSGAISIKTQRDQIRLGEPVRWSKNITLDTPENVSIELPSEAGNISVRKVEFGSEKEVDSISIISGNAVNDGAIKSSRHSILEKLLSMLTGRAIQDINDSESSVNAIQISLSDNATDYVIEYETPAPIAIEKKISRGKEVIISGPDKLNYTDVLSFTNIDEFYDISEQDQIKIYWVENRSFVNFDAYDTDENGMLDYIEWITPHLSNQTFEIILISKAEHLDENKTFVEDIYSLVKDRDYNYSLVPAGHYVRVTFEKNLTNKNDITLYVKSNDSAQIEVYEENSTQFIEIFDNVHEDGMYKIYLTNLSHEQMTFDLLVKNSDVEFDYIIDPTILNLLPNSGGQLMELGIMSEILTAGATNATGITSSDANSSCYSNVSATGDGNDCLNAGGTASLDAVFLWNVTLPTYVSLNNITLTSISAKVGSVADNLSIALFNFTSGRWLRVNNTINPTQLVNTTMIYIVDSSNSGDFISNGLIRFLSYVQGGANADLRQEYFSALTVYVSYPRVLLNSPMNGTLSTGLNINFSANYTSDVALLLSNATLYLWNSTNDLINTTTIIINGTSNSTNVSLTLPYEGVFTWNYQAFDNASNSAFNSTNYTITADTTFPSVYLNAPENGSAITSLSVTFNATFADGVQLSNATLYLWNSTNDLINSTMNRTLSGKTDSLNLTVIFPYTGDFKWNYHVFDSLAHSSFNSTNYTITVLTYPPRINFVSPTPADAIITNNDSIPINISIVEDTLSVFNFIWNGTNYTFYNDSVLFSSNFNNNSMLGENQTNIVNLAKYSMRLISNTTMIFNSSGKYGGAWQFNGVNTSIDNSTANTVCGLTNGATWSAWIYRSDSGRDGTIFYKSDGDTQDGWWISITAKNHTHFDAVGSSGNLMINFSGVPNPGQWFHLAVTWNGTLTNTSVRAYINGANSSVNRSNGAGTTHTDICNYPFSIGRPALSGFTVGYFNGSIDEPIIFNRTLSPDEINQLYMSNLYKYNATQWYFYTNQSKNSSNGLDDTNYTYQAFASDIDGNSNLTEQRTITINNTPLVSFVPPTPADVATTLNVSIPINISIRDNNVKSIIYNWNNVNYTFYNDSVSFMANFNNYSILGENNTYIVDTTSYRTNLRTNSTMIYNNAGVYGGAWQFNGRNASMVNSTSNDVCGLINGSTWSAWIYRDNTIRNQTIFYKSDNDASSGWWISTTSDNMTELATVNTGTNMVVHFNGLQGRGVWQHIAITWTGVGTDTVSSRGYVNGVEVTQGDRNVNGSGPHVDSCNDIFTIGRGHVTAVGSNGFFNGTMDEPIIFNRTLSPEEVAQMYMSNLQRYDMKQWYLYVNQSKNATSGLINGTYTYQSFVTDMDGNSNPSETRTIIIEDLTTRPSISFVSPTPANATTTSNTTIPINISIAESTLNNLIYNWNGTNYTMYNRSLILMYNFENRSELGENSTYIADIGPLISNGTFRNGFWSPTAGKYGGAFDFNNINTNISSGDVNAIDTATQLSACAWVNHTSTTDDDYIIRKSDSGTTDGIAFFRDDVAAISGRTDTYVIVVLDSGDTDSVRIEGATDASLVNNWTHVCFTATLGSATGLRLYVNGKEDPNSPADITSIGAINAGTNPLIIGTSAGQGVFNGSIDEVTVWNRSLSDLEISQLYISNLQKFNQTQWYLYVNQSKNSTAGLDDGTYTYYSYVSDTFGDANITETRTLRIGNDLISPTIDFVSPTETNNSNINRDYILVNVTASDNTALSNITVILFNSTINLINSTSSSSSPFYVNFSGLSDGIYYFNATATDTSNNLNSTETRKVIVDRTSPTVDFVSPTESSGTLLTKNSILINVTASDYSPGSISIITINLYNSTSLVNSTATSVSPNFVNITGLPDGLYYFNATASDLAGNGNKTLTRNVTIDTGIPQVTINSPQNITYFALPLIFNVSLNENGSSVMYSLDNGVNNYSMSSTDNINYNASNSSLADGGWTFRVYANDTVGNKNYSESRTFSLLNTQLTSCGNLTIANTVYTLQNNITDYAGTCFQIQADNVTFDGQGYTVDGTNNASVEYWAIFSVGFGNITIKNLNIKEFGDFACSENCFGGGIRFESASNSMINNITFTSDYFAFYGLLNSDNNTIINNVGSNNTYGITLDSSSNNLIANNTFSNNTYIGITISSSSNNNQIVNNSANNNGQFGIYFGGVNNNYLINNVANDNSQRGIRLSTSNHNQLINNTFNNNAGNGIELQSNSKNNTIVNQIVGGNPVAILDTTKQNNTLAYNNSFGEIRWTRSNLTMNGTLSFPGNIILANNSAYVNSGAFTGNINTSANVTLRGTPGVGMLLPAILKDGAQCTDCYNFTALSAEIVIFNVSSWSNYTIGDTFSPNLTSCGNLTVANTVYTLQNNITDYAGTCFQIQADNVTFDGQGYTVDGDDSGGDYGIYMISMTNLTVKNAIVSDFNNGIGILAGSNSQFINNTLTSNTLNGIGFYSGSTNNKIIDNTFNRNIEVILFSQASDNNNFTNNIANNNDIGIGIAGSSNNQFTGGILNGTRQNAISLTLNSLSNNFTNISITNTNLSFNDIKFGTAGTINGTYLTDMPHIGNYSFTGIGGLTYFKNSRFGEIRFLNLINGSSTNLTSEVKILNNSAFVNSSVANGGLNKSANITFYGLSTGFTNPVILKDGVQCTDCYNFTSLNAGTVIFNVSSWSNYTIGETPDTTFPSINFVSPTPENATTTSNMTIPINISIAESNLANVIYDWNGTNYTMYNDSVILLMGLNNLSNIGENATYFADVSRFANNGTCSGTTCPVLNLTGKYGGGYTFDGFNDYINLSNASYLNPTERISVSAWIYPVGFAEASPNIKGILSKYQTGAANGLSFTLGQPGQKSRVYIGLEIGGVSQSIGSSVNVTLNSWHHVATAYNGSQLSLYLDGISVGNLTATGTLKYTKDPLYIGSDFGISGRNFNGTIDEVQMRNRSLSEDEVQQIYMSSLYRYNQTQWYLYVNQSKNATSGLDNGTYTYYSYASDTAGNANITETRTINISTGVANTLPNVTLISPSNGNATTNRTIAFTWNATDAESDPLTYQINITAMHIVVNDFLCSDNILANASSTSFIPSYDLRCLYDNGYAYNWTVRAHDGTGYGPWAAVRTLNVTAVTTISLVNDSMLFGSINILSYNDTLDNSPSPFVVQNDGNAFLNITISGTSLWNSIVNPSKYFKFKIGNNTFSTPNENGSFDWGSSLTDWRNVSTSEDMAISYLNYSEASDSARTDIYVEVPSGELPGTKTSTITFNAILGE